MTQKDEQYYIQGVLARDKRIIAKTITIHISSINGLRSISTRAYYFFLAEITMTIILIPSNRVVIVGCTKQIEVSVIVYVRRVHRSRPLCVAGNDLM